MSITTFADLITTPKTKKIALVEIEPSERIVSWALYSGSIYRTAVAVIDILSVTEETTVLTEVSSIAAISAGEWYHGKDYVYLQPSSGTPYSKVIVFDYKIYYANENIVFNGNYYDGIVQSIPNVKQEKSGIYWGISIISGGNIILANDGSQDEIFKNYAWLNKNITILLGGEDLPYSEYKKQFKGKITRQKLSTSEMELIFEDTKNVLQMSIPTNVYNTDDYPNLDSEDDGRVKALAYGTVFKIPVVCTTKALGTSTSNHNFKILDTSVCSVQTINQVYVEDVAVSHQSGSVSDASFKLNTSTYSPGDFVTVSIVADISNPVEQIKHIASNVLSIPYNSDNYNTATISTAITETEIYPTGLYIGETKSFLAVIGELMKSCMGYFFNDNDGLYAITVWDILVEEDLDSIDYTDINEGSFSVSSEIEDVKKMVRIGWRKNWGSDTYAYKQLSSDTTEKEYDIVKSKTIPTLLSTLAGATILSGRLGMIFETETVKVAFATKIQLAEKNIGDRIYLSVKRRDGDDNITWLDNLMGEINRIVKDYTDNIIFIEMDDLKGIGYAVGHWTSDAPVFPENIGGGSAAIWDKGWSIAKKNFARANYGYWTDDDGFADSTDSTSYMKSRWW